MSPPASSQLRRLAGLLANASSSPAVAVLRCCTAVDRLVCSSALLDSALVASGLLASLVRARPWSASAAHGPCCSVDFHSLTVHAFVQCTRTQAQALDHPDGSVRLEVLRVIKSVYQHHPKPKELLARCETKGVVWSTDRFSVVCGPS